MQISEEVRNFLREIGRKGGKRSKRKLTKEESYRIIMERIRKLNQTPRKLASFMNSLNEKEKQEREK